MTYNLEIDSKKALDLLREAVKGNETFVYKYFEEAPSCRYQHEGNPSCLIGKVLNLAGVPVFELDLMDAIPEPDETDGQIVIGGSSINEVTLPEGVVLTPKAMTTLATAQSYQDLGFTWGRALQAAEKAATVGDESYG